jgi:hypothetical protein
LNSPISLDEKAAPTREFCDLVAIWSLGQASCIVGAYADDPADV